MPGLPGILRRGTPDLEVDPGPVGRPGDLVLPGYAAVLRVPGSWSRHPSPGIRRRVGACVRKRRAWDTGLRDAPGSGAVRWRRRRSRLQVLDLEDRLVPDLPGVVLLAEGDDHVDLVILERVGR